MSQITQYLLHMPWWAAALVAVVGIWLFVAGNKRMDKTLRRVGAVIVVVAVILGLVGFFYLTPLQRAVERTKRMIHDVDRQDWTDFQRLLDDQTVVQADRRMVAAGKEEVLSRFKAAYDRFGVKSVWNLSIEGTQTDTLITVTVTVVSTQDFTQDRPETSTWQLDFQQNGSKWELEKMTLLHVNGEDEQHPFNPFW